MMLEIITSTMSDLSLHGFLSIKSFWIIRNQRLMFHKSLNLLFQFF